MASKTTDSGLVECICAFAFDRDDCGTQVVCAATIWRADDKVERSSPQYFVDRSGLRE